MKTVCFIGSNENCLHNAQKACTELSYGFRNFSLGGRFLLSDYKMMIMQTAKGADIIIFEVASFLDDETEIAGIIDETGRSLNTDIIIAAPDFSEASSLIRTLKGLGFHKITMQHVNQRKLYEEFRMHLTAPVVNFSEVDEEIEEERSLAIEAIKEQVPDLSILSELAQQEEERRDDDFLAGAVSIPKREPVYRENRIFEETQDMPSQKREKKPKKRKEQIIKIGVAGCMPRIGTTTVCMQLVKAANTERAHTAAYIEFNDSGYVENIRNFCNIADADARLSKIVFQNTDLYDAPKVVNEIMRQGYEYLVYDYGSFHEADHKSLFEKDVIVLVGGIESDELRFMDEVLPMLENQRNVFYAFSFADAALQEEILENMRGERENTFFMPYIPDKFSYAYEAAQDFEKIFNADFDIKDETGGRFDRLARIGRRR